MYVTSCPRWLRENLHLRYMWIPHTDTVVVVQCNPARSQEGATKAPTASLGQRLKPLRGEIGFRDAPGAVG